MKILDVSSAVGGNILFTKMGTFKFLQDAVKENDLNLITTVVSSALGIGYSLSIPYALFGVVRFGSGLISAGCVLFNGELYLTDTVTLSGTVYGKLDVTQYTVNADPTDFSDGVPRNVHNIRKIVWTNSSTDALFNMSALVNITRLASNITYINGSADSADPIVISRKGTEVNIRGKYYDSTSYTITTNFTILTIDSVDCRPTVDRFVTFVDTTTHVVGYLQITSGGILKIRGDWQNVSSAGINLNVTIDIR
jgi:hypothetical protein